MKTNKTINVFTKIVMHIANGGKTQLAILIGSAIINSNTMSAERIDKDPKKLENTLTKKTAQKNLFQLGCGFETYFSGSAHGAFYLGYVNVSKGNITLSGGPCIQDRSLQIKGGKIRFAYTLFGENYDSVGDETTVRELRGVNDPILKLSLFGSLQYIHQAPLSYNASRVEHLTNPEVTQDWNKVMLSTCEMAVGAELNVKINKRINWKSFAGASVFYHLNYDDRMYHDRSAIAFTFGTGINIPSF